MRKIITKIKCTKLIDFTATKYITIRVILSILENIFFNIIFTKDKSFILFFFFFSFFIVSPLCKTISIFLLSPCIEVLPESFICNKDSFNSSSSLIISILSLFSCPIGDELLKE